MVSKITVQSLWIGNKLSRMEIYSIKSFLNLGFKFHLYTYEKVEGIPNGVVIKDGNKILPKKEVFKLKQTFLPFSDIFRYKMLYEVGGYWVDLDMIAVKMFDFTEPYIFSSERTIQKGAYKMKVKYVPNIGVLKAPPKSEFYKELYEKCMEHHKKGNNKDKIKYMRILRDMIEKYNFSKYVKKPEVFCHLDWWHAKDAFIGDCCKEKYGVPKKTIKSMFNGPYTVHFWRDLVTKKYKLDNNENYDKNSLWELMLEKVDGKNKKKSNKIKKYKKIKTKKAVKRIINIS
jgi:hypothetical protein